MSTASLLVYATVAICLARLWSKLTQASRSVGDLPGPLVLIEPFTALSNVLPRIPLIAKGNTRETELGYADFISAGYDAFALKHVWPNAGAMLFVADPDAIKEITTHRARFPKPLKNYEVVSFFGGNIVATEGEEWKRHRKICAPAFSERNNKLVWDESVRVVLELIDGVWKRADTLSTDHVLELTVQITLFVISAAAFGRHMSFTEETEVPSGFRIGFKDALRIVSENVFIKLAVPNRLMGFSRRLREVDQAFSELEKYMLEMIYTRKHAGATEGHHDLFSSLLDAANGDFEGVSRLGDSELIGNIFVFLLAGHETTANTLAFCFALLALYPEKQEKLFLQTRSVMASLGHRPEYEDMPLFTYALAVFYETLRIRPPVNMILKCSAEDTNMNVKDAQGNTRTIPVPKGMPVNIHVSGLHHNPRYWENPNEFIPERFLGDYKKDAFLPFSGGPRACIGRRFAESEEVAVIIMLVSQYQISVKADPKYAGETREQRKARLLDVKNGISMTAVSVPLTFKRRV
ncbi:unnamed protein product [Peniophora sp. CBMAI 1063]|nr:unnamed protein product [Peniophora sp. CBMAI 1063]